MLILSINSLTSEQSGVIFKTSQILFFTNRFFSFELLDQTTPIVNLFLIGTFTIEPMINFGKKEVKLLPDNWTVVTKDHSLSAQWEHTILVTKDGYEVLTMRPEEKI